MKLAEVVVLLTTVISVILVFFGAVILNLQIEVTNLRSDVEELKSPKTWHSVANFVTNQPWESPKFVIWEDMWRIKWNFTAQSISVWIDRWHGFMIYDGGDYAIGGLELYNTSKGVFYVHQGRGYYYTSIMGITGTFTFSFAVESYY